MALHAFAALKWQSAPMPGANAAAQIAHLPALADRGFRAFVRFPAGWERLAPGHYAVAEEFLVLDGELDMNGRTWRAGGYAWIPPGLVRAATGSRTGCLAFAWFGATPRWSAGAPAVPAREPETFLAHWHEAPGIDLAGGAPGHLLHDAPAHRTWIDTRPPGPVLQRQTTAVETLDLSNHAWANADPALM